MKTTPNKRAKKRKYVRFAAEVGMQAFVLSDDEGKKLKTPLPALVVEESYKGCSLVVLKSSLYHEGAQLKIKVGELDPMMAEIRWIKTFDGKVCSLGLVYVEQD